MGRKLGFIGSGIGGGTREVPCLARTSAASFPSFPTCALIQCRMILCVVFSLERFLVQLSTIWDFASLFVIA